MSLILDCGRIKSSEYHTESVIKDLCDFDIQHGIVNGPTPNNKPLSGQYKQSFAYYTFRERLPNTLNNVIKSLEQVKQQNDLNSSQEEINNVIHLVQELKQQMNDDCPLTVFEGNEPDKDTWNMFIKSLPSDECSFYKTCWLYGECYMYRKLSSIFEASPTLNHYDYFSPQKLNALKLATGVMEAVAKSTNNLENNVQNFCKLLKLNLWSNRCDLSITSGQEVRPTCNLLDVIDSLNGNILIDDSEKIWNCLQSTKEEQETKIIIDFICDNAGFELFTDLLLAQYLIEQQLAHTVRFNIKAIPWYVSDTTAQDIHCSLKYLQEYESTELNRLANAWSQYFEDGHFVMVANEQFWTSPYEYYRMSDINPELYESLKQSSLLIFKGDLNYRKLLGDFNWDFCEKFEKCLRGFQPTNLCTLRTVKGDLICNLKPGQAEELSQQNADWMFTGEYGLIQFQGLIKD